MESLYLLIPIALFIFGVIVGLLFWAVKSGQFDDLEREGSRILFNDDVEVSNDRSNPDSDRP